MGRHSAGAETIDNEAFEAARRQNALLEALAINEADIFEDEGGPRSIHAKGKRPPLPIGALLYRNVLAGPVNDRKLVPMVHAYMGEDKIVHPFSLSKPLPEVVASRFRDILDEQASKIVGIHAKYIREHRPDPGLYLGAEANQQPENFWTTEQFTDVLDAQRRRELEAREAERQARAQYVGRHAAGWVKDEDTNYVGLRRRPENLPGKHHRVDPPHVTDPDALDLAA